VLPDTRNMAFPSNKLIREGVAILQRRLPPGWTAGEVRPGLGGPAGSDALELIGADGTRGTLALEAKPSLDPRRARELEVSRAGIAAGSLVVVAPFLSEATRARLREAGVGYIDLTGNVRIAIQTPAIYIETQGAAENPDPEARPTRSLRGPKAGRIVRALVDYKTPPRVRELAQATGIDAGYVSRVLAFLEAESLVTRVGHGRMQAVDWKALVQRWAQEAPLDSRAAVATYLEPRGLSALTDKLVRLNDQRYAVTGSLAAATLAPAAGTRLAAIWVRDAAAIAKTLGLRSTDAGANVLLLEPMDDSVFERGFVRDGIQYAAPSQVVADLLTSPGRGPAEGDALIGWMESNEDQWRQQAISTSST
jgi:hypothetical protein